MNPKPIAIKPLDSVATKKMFDSLSKAKASKECAETYKKLIDKYGKVKVVN